MKESNFLADNVAKNTPVRMILQNTEGQFMKASNILADNVVKNTPVRMILQTQNGSS